MTGPRDTMSCLRVSGARRCGAKLHDAALAEQRREERAAALRDFLGEARGQLLAGARLRRRGIIATADRNGVGRVNGGTRPNSIGKTWSPAESAQEGSKQNGENEIAR